MEEGSGDVGELVDLVELLEDHGVEVRRLARSVEVAGRVLAAGDSYNDTTMLGAADAGYLFHAPPNVIAEFPQFPALDTYDDLRAAIGTHL